MDAVNDEKLISNTKFNSIRLTNEKLQAPVGCIFSGSRENE